MSGRGGFCVIWVGFALEVFVHFIFGLYPCKDTTFSGHDPGYGESQHTECCYVLRNFTYYLFYKQSMKIIYMDSDTNKSRREHH